MTYLYRKRKLLLVGDSVFFTQEFLMVEEGYQVFLRSDFTGLRITGFRPEPCFSDVAVVRSTHKDGTEYTAYINVRNLSRA